MAAMNVVDAPALAAATAWFWPFPPRAIDSPADITVSPGAGILATCNTWSMFALTWRRAFVATGDAKKGDTFMIRFALRNLGFR